MNLFRSEEHVRRWKHFMPESAESMTVTDRAFVQGTESRTGWTRITCLGGYLSGRVSGTRHLKY